MIEYDEICLKEIMMMINRIIDVIMNKINTLWKFADDEAFDYDEELDD